jgi:1,4-alpha-glucan branching enzyme
MIDKQFIETSTGTVARVTFTLPESIWAAAIFLVGDFNDWDRGSHPMRQDGEGRWTTTLDLEAGHAYQFRYLVDGEWMNDNQADAYAFNQYGTHNFIVVTDPGFRQHPD